MAEFKYSDIEKEMQAYGFDGVVKSHCRMCHGGCGVLVYTKNGKIAKIAGDPNCPINHGTLCSKGIASAQLAYHPDRLTYPVRRLGPKGSGKWQRISWDEALDHIAKRILDYKAEFGAESIVMGYGTGMDPRVVSAEHAWWFPEKKDPGHGWDESNINILTDNAYETCDPAMGATHVRTLLCRIYPQNERGGS